MPQAISRDASPSRNIGPEPGPSFDQEASHFNLSRPLSGSRYPALGRPGAAGRPVSPLSISSRDSDGDWRQPTPQRRASAEPGSPWAPASPHTGQARSPSPPPPSYHPPGRGRPVDERYDEARSVAAFPQPQGYQLQQMSPVGQKGYSPSYAPQTYAPQPYAPQTYAPQSYAQQGQPLPYQYSPAPMVYHAGHEQYASHQYETGYPHDPQASAAYAPAQGAGGYASRYGGAAAMGCCSCIPLMAAGCCIGELCSMGTGAMTSCLMGGMF